MNRALLPVIALALLTQAIAAQPGNDSAFKAMQARGKHAMGVDQYSSFHVFGVLRDGGRIELQRPGADAREVEAIRSHLKDIAQKFAEGDFSIPGFVHDEEVPGTKTLAARRDRIRYRFGALPKGGEVRILTKDRLALAALAEFMAFQGREHRAAGHHH